ncbi:hypothetical protein GW17_00015038 [Ensete ventricosum]|nr:hypothetical protein GW17_00015038 [Ensete ventricosum]
MATTHPFRLPVPLKSSSTRALIPRNYFSSFAMAANARSCVGGDAERIDVESDVKVEDNNNDKEEKEDLCCRIDRQETLAADTMYWFLTTTTSLLLKKDEWRSVT